MDGLRRHFFNLVFPTTNDEERAMMRVFFRNRIRSLCWKFVFVESLLFR